MTPRLWTVRVVQEFVAFTETAQQAESLWEEAMRDDDGRHAQVVARPLRDPMTGEYPLPPGWQLNSLAYGVDEHAATPIDAAIEMDRHEYVTEEDDGDDEASDD